MLDLREYFPQKVAAFSTASLGFIMSCGLQAKMEAEKRLRNCEGVAQSSLDSVQLPPSTTAADLTSKCAHLREAASDISR